MNVWREANSLLADMEALLAAIRDNLQEAEEVAADLRRKVDWPPVADPEGDPHGRHPRHAGDL
jgi:hypothetical protein